VSFVVIFLPMKFASMGISRCPSIYEHRQLDRSHSPKSINARQRGSYRTPRVENVVNQDDVFVVDVRRDFRPMNDGLRGDLRQIIPVEIDVEHSHLGLLPGPEHRYARPYAEPSGCLCAVSRAVRPDGPRSPTQSDRQESPMCPAPRSPS
jgi:hypothetical protein